MTESELFLLKQENLYCNSEFIYKEWYKLIKLGKNTSYINMFSVWTKIDEKCFDGYIEVLEIENYPETGVDSLSKLFIQFIKQILRFK